MKRREFLRKCRLIEKCIKEGYGTDALCFLINQGFGKGLMNRFQRMQKGYWRGHSTIASKLRARYSFYSYETRQSVIYMTRVFCFVEWKLHVLKTKEYEIF